MALTARQRRMRRMHHAAMVIAAGGVKSLGTIDAPVLAWDGETTDATPDFSVTLTGPLASDTVTLNLYSDSGLTTRVDTASATLTDADIIAGTISLALGSQSDGTYYAQVIHARTNYTSGTSNTVTVTLDTTAPTLSSPGSSAITATTATITVTTDDATGTLYYVVTTSSTPPSKAQVKAGNNDGGTAAAKSGSQAIASTGAKTANLTGLSSSTAYYGYWMHEDANGNQSSVSATGLFTTSSSYSQIRPTFGGAAYLSYTSNTSIADSTGVTISFWLDAGAVDGSARGIIAHAAGAGTGRVQVQRNASNKINWVFVNSSGTSLWTAADTTNFLDASGLTHFAIAFDASTGTGQYYRNGVSTSVTNTVGPTTGTVNWARNAQGSALFASGTGTAIYTGTAGDLWISNSFIDLSTNIGTFYNGGTPPDLTGFGSPAIWLGKDMTVANWNAGQNRGSMTATLTMNGTVT